MWNGWAKWFCGFSGDVLRFAEVAYMGCCWPPATAELPVVLDDCTGSPATGGLAASGSTAPPLPTLPPVVVAVVVVSSG